MPFLRQTAQDYHEPVIIELGTRTGQSTSAFLAAIETYGGELWSVDIDEAQVPSHWRGLPYWHFLRADDLHPAAQAWLPQRCDILFIDTSHEYGHTLAELRIYAPRVLPGGVVLCHDTQFEPPGHDRGTPDGEVAQALDTYCKEAGLSWENRPGFYGLGTIIQR